MSKDSPGARKGSGQEARSRHLCRAPTFPHTCHLCGQLPALGGAWGRLVGTKVAPAAGPMGQGVGGSSPSQPHPQLGCCCVDRCFGFPTPARDRCPRRCSSLAARGSVPTGHRVEIFREPWGALRQLQQGWGAAGWTSALGSAARAAPASRYPNTAGTNPRDSGSNARERTPQRAWEKYSPWRVPTLPGIPGLLLSCTKQQEQQEQKNFLPGLPAQEKKKRKS